MNDQTALYIDDTRALAALCTRLRGTEWIALDTEFVREKTLYPILCLIQIASADTLACIDPLALPDLDPLLDVLNDPAITKVMHAARQDMEIFNHLRGELPRPVFDTQLAAPLLGLQEQIGYAALVDNILNVKLDKAHIRADWSQRPLSPAQLEYAADDVRYLAVLYPRLRDTLAAKARLQWLAGDFAELSNPRLYACPPADAWLRIKGTPRLRTRQLAVAQALAAWREETAQRQNRPRSWILRDENLLDLARLQPLGIGELAQVRGLHEQAVARRGAARLAPANGGRNTAGGVTRQTETASAGRQPSVVARLTLFDEFERVAVRVAAKQGRPARFAQSIRDDSLVEAPAPRRNVGDCERTVSIAAAMGGPPGGGIGKRQFQKMQLLGAQPQPCPGVAEIGPCRVRGKTERVAIESQGPRGVRHQHAYVQ